MTDEGRAYLGTLSAQCNWVTPDWTTADGIADKTPLVAVLLDLMRYEDYRLMTKALQVIDLLHSVNGDLTSLAVQGLILTTKNSKSLEISIGKTLPQMKRLCSGQMDAASAQNYVKIATYYCSMCYLGGGGSTLENPLFNGQPVRAAGQGWSDPGREHRINKDIMFNSGVLSDGLDVISKPSQPPAVLRATVWLLRALVANFARVQVLLFENIDSILTTETSEDAD